MAGPGNIDDDIRRISETHTFSRNLPGSEKKEEQEHFIKKNDPVLYRLTQQIGDFNKSFDQPQIITLDKFERFEPLFSKNSAKQYSTDELREIGEEFKNTIDFYRTITVIYTKEEPIVLLTLPRIFTPFQSLSKVKDTQLSGLNDRIGRKDPYLSRGTVKPYAQMIKDANFKEENIESLKNLRLETYELLMRFRKTKEEYRKFEEKDEEIKDTPEVSSNESGHSLINEVEFAEEED